MKSLFPLIILCCLALAGCSHKPTTIVGTWIYRDQKSPGNYIIYVFRSDDEYTYSEHTVYESIHSHESSSGTYYVHDGVLTVNTTQEQMGIDADTMAAIDARERQINPHLHIPQDKGDVPVRVEQPVVIFRYSISEDNKLMRLKDTSNAADFGKVYTQIPNGQSS